MRVKNVRTTLCLQITISSEASAEQCVQSLRGNCSSKDDNEVNTPSSPVVCSSTDDTGNAIQTREYLEMLAVCTTYIVCHDCS